MDDIAYDTIAFGELDLLSPVSSERLDHVIDLIELTPEARVADLCCGKGEALVRVLGRFGCQGFGVDQSPAFVTAARAEASSRLSPGQATLTEDDVSFMEIAHESLDLVILMNARPWGDHRGTLSRAWAMVRSGGYALIGEHFWRDAPVPAIIDAIGGGADAHKTHAGNIDDAVAESFTPLYATAASRDERDRYEWAQILAVERFARANPGHPDARAFRDRARSWRDLYLRQAAAALGFGLYVYLK